MIQFLAKCAVIEVHVARLKYSCMTGGRLAMRHGSQIDWLSCLYESDTRMPLVRMHGERTGRLCLQLVSGRRSRPNRDLQTWQADLEASAASLYSLPTLRRTPALVTEWSQNCGHLDELSY